MAALTVFHPSRHCFGSQTDVCWDCVSLTVSALSTNVSRSTQLQWLKRTSADLCPAECQQMVSVVCVKHTGGVEARLAEARLAEERLAEARLAEVRLAEVRLAEVRLAEARLAEARLAEERLAEARLAEERLAEARLAEVRLAEVRLAEAQRGLALPHTQR
ncbi:unnamed protein product [Boreogadus saida]